MEEGLWEQYDPSHWDNPDYRDFSEYFGTIPIWQDMGLIKVQPKRDIQHNRSEVILGDK